MKRNAFEVVRRGFDNAVANWPLVLIRVAEAVVLVGIAIGAIIAAVAPILVSAGLGNFDMGDPQNIAEFFATLVIEHWVLLLYIFGLAFLILGVLIAVHSFFEAGAARVYVDAEHTADLRAFTVERWFRGGRHGWWSLFWIYNLAWSVGCIVLLVPAVFTIVFMLMVNEWGPRAAIGCAGLALMAVLAIPTAILVGMWTQKAIAICVGRDLGATESLGAARREIKLDFGRHFAVALIMMVIALVAGSVISSVSFPFSILGSHSRRVDLLPLFLAPMQLVIGMVQGAVSAAVQSWNLSSFVALTEER